MELCNVHLTYSIPIQRMLIKILEVDIKMVFVSGGWWEVGYHDVTAAVELATQLIELKFMNG